jgi:hypothetical protein
MNPGRMEEKGLRRLCSCSLVGWRIDYVEVLSMYPGRVEDKSLRRLCPCTLVGWRMSLGRLCPSTLAGRRIKAPLSLLSWTIYLLGLNKLFPPHD